MLKVYCGFWNSSRQPAVGGVLIAHRSKQKNNEKLFTKFDQIL